jgi:hypothetical protein
MGVDDRVGSSRFIAVIDAFPFLAILMYSLSKVAALVSNVPHSSVVAQGTSEFPQCFWKLRNRFPIEMLYSQSALIGFNTRTIDEFK